MKLSSLLPNHLIPENSKTLEITSISSDSREVIAGTLFFALSGTRLEGANFVKEAIAKGAVAIVSEKEIFSLLEISIPIIHVENATTLLSLCAYKLATPLPDHLIAITGTNGKTSTADFLRQIWALQEKEAASIGTLGIRATTGDIEASHTTPPPVFLAKYLHQLKETGVNHVALEASSHGLVQNRLKGLFFEAVGFTSFSRDHLDYHKTEENYLTAKLTLFKELRQKNAPIVAATACGTTVIEALRKIADETHAPLRTVGKNGNFLNLIETSPLPDGQLLTISFQGQKSISVHLPIPGIFQAQNALLAIALACPNTADESEIYHLLKLLPQLKPIPGRAQFAGKTQNGANVYIDYAHTPDAIERIVESLRPHLKPKGKLFIVFGAGGNRDKGKRPLMGQAANLADFVIVTDDNPRFEDPDLIRKEVLNGCKKAIEIADRKEAIAYALKQLQEGDILLIAGKGHEKGQEIQGKILPFDDFLLAQQLGKLTQGAF
ncbi:UDP-N-acetylmuramoyl-L-alanyl-D-glutamate--2,6-diaminopimelate ligase [Acetobacteraceae bacterium]|nr:UDP-N-acetylmuramoyl-L-alanyl-D-glutamate--2,6-diaminopimelate ligase [Acetobacteraceae bacterium]